MNLGQHADSMSWGWSRHPTCQGRVLSNASGSADLTPCRSGCSSGAGAAGRRAWASSGHAATQQWEGQVKVHWNPLKSFEPMAHEEDDLDSDHCFPVMTFFRAGNFLRNRLRRFPWNDQLVRFCCPHTRVGLLCLLAWVAGTWSPAPLIMETVHFLLPPWLTPSEDSWTIGVTMVFHGIWLGPGLGKGQCRLIISQHLPRCGTAVFAAKRGAKLIIPQSHRVTTLLISQADL